LKGGGEKGEESSLVLVVVVRRVVRVVVNGRVVSAVVAIVVVTRLTNYYDYNCCCGCCYEEIHHHHHHHVVYSPEPIFLPVTAHLPPHTSLTNTSTSSWLNTNSSGSKLKFWISLILRCCWSLCLTARERPSMTIGSMGQLANWHRTNAAIDWPKMAGMVPRTGKTRIRKLSTTPKAPDEWGGRRR